MEDNNLGTTHLTFVALTIKQNSWADLLEAFTGEELVYNKSTLDYPRSLLSSPDTHTYASVRDLVWMPWIKETYSNVEITGKHEQLTLHKTVCEVVENSQNFGEQYFYIPSRALLDGLNISQTDYVNFYATDNSVLGIAHSININRGSFEDQQDLLFARSDMLQDAIENMGQKLFWLCFESRNTTAYFRENISKNQWPRRCRSWLVWKENNDFRSIKYHEGPFFND